MFPLLHSVPALTDSTIKGGMSCLFFLLKAGKERFESYIAQELHDIVNFTKYSQNTKAHMGFRGGGGLAHPSGYLRKHVRLCVKVCVWGGCIVSAHIEVYIPQKKFLNSHRGMKKVIP